MKTILLLLSLLILASCERPVAKVISTGEKVYLKSNIPYVKGDTVLLCYNLGWYLDYNWRYNDTTISNNRYVKAVIQ
jgi:hypothetical protein